LRPISCRRFSQPLQVKKVLPWSKSNILMKSLSAFRGVLRESVQSEGCSIRFGGKSGKSTIANAWSVLSLTLKKRSLYRFFSHLSIAAGSDFTILIAEPERIRTYYGDLSAEPLSQRLGQFSPMGWFFLHFVQYHPSFSLTCFRSSLAVILLSSH
jgi:hypothetical protein